MTELTADVVYPKRSSYPMIVNFQNAYVTSQFHDTECSLCTNEDIDRKTVLTQLGDMLYMGEENDEPIGRTLMIARDRSTGKVRIIEPGHVELKPLIENDMNASQQLETSGLELSRKFGSKKQKQQMEQRAKLKMNVEAVTEQVSSIKLMFIFLDESLIRRTTDHTLLTLKKFFLSNVKDCEFYITC